MRNGPIVKGVVMAALVLILANQGAPMASAQVCEPPACGAATPTEADSRRVVEVAPPEFERLEDVEGVLGRSDGATGVPFLAVYVGLSAVGATLAVIAGRRRAAPVQIVIKKRRRPMTNAEWAAQMVAEAKMLDSNPDKLLGSTPQVDFGGAPTPPAGAS